MHVTVDTSDNASPAIKRLINAQKQINPVVGRSATNLFKEHFKNLQNTRRNKFNAKSTRFYARCAEGTHFDLLPDGVLIGVNSVGIRLKYYGGTVKPGKNISRYSQKPTQWLTIPATGKAYGHRAAEFPNLKFFLNPRDPSTAYLVERPTYATRGNRKTGVKKGDRIRGLLMYVLKKEVTYQEDKTVIPNEGQIALRIQADLEDFSNRLYE
jgi:hypothetical protein